MTPPLPPRAESSGLRGLPFPLGVGGGHSSCPALPVLAASDKELCVNSKVSSIVPDGAFA